MSSTFVNYLAHLFSPIHIDPNTLVDNNSYCYYERSSSHIHLEPNTLVDNNKYTNRSSLLGMFIFPYSP